MVAREPATKDPYTMKQTDGGFTVAEAARQLNFTRQYLYKFIDLGRLQPRAVKKLEYRVTQADIDELRERLERNR
jgi:excisionase family DNA binding protein